MNISTSYALAFILVFSSTISHASQVTEPLEALDQNRPRRSHSQMELLSGPEIAIVQTITSKSSDVHLADYKREIDSQNKSLTDALVESQNSRIHKKVRWLSFHEGSSGKLRATGYIVASLSSVSWVISLTPVPCEVQNWMGIGATAGLAIGGAFVWLAKKSEETATKLDGELMAVRGRLLHEASLIDQELALRHPGEPPEPESKPFRHSSSTHLRQIDDVAFPTDQQLDNMEKGKDED